MTDAETIHQFRLPVLNHAEESGNVAATCRLFNVSRKTFYKWRARAERYGTDALMPKGRRVPQMPNATPTHIVERLLALAVQEPTIGARRYADRLEHAGFDLSRATVQRLLNRHGLGRRSHRVARAAAIMAMTSGLVMGRCYKLTAVDVATRWAMVWIVAGPIRSELSIEFIGRVVAAMAKRGVGVRAVVTTMVPSSSRPVFGPGSRNSRSSMCGSRPGHRTTTPCRTVSRNDAPGRLAARVPPATVHLDPSAPGRG